jgi:type II secretory pathway component PulL
LASLAERLIDKEDVIAALPGEGAVTRDLNLPMKREGDAKRAAALMIEDELAAPLEDAQTAFGPLRDGKRLTSSVPSALIEEALLHLTDAGIEPTLITIDHAVLPPPDEGEAAVLLLGDRIAVRLAGSAFTSEPSFANDVLAASEATERPADIGELQFKDIPNFRKGRFAKRTPLPDFRPFLLAASLALAAGIVFLAGSVTEGLKYSSAAAGARQEAEAAFAEAYPGRPVLDLERQLRSAQSSSGGGSDFVPLVAALTEALEAQDDTFLTALDYRDDGELRAELVFASLSELEDLVAELQAMGVATREGSDVRREDDALVSSVFLETPR